MLDNALMLLRAITWLPVSSPELSPLLLDWLLEENSMTKRFECHCQKVTVAPQREAYISAADIGDEGRLLPQESRYWLREVVLLGDGIPWLAARTIVPQSTLAGPEIALRELGTRPLGSYLFSSAELTRDFIEPGTLAPLWGRRSRLRLSGKPLLLTELFLPAAPLYLNLSSEGTD